MNEFAPPHALVVGSTSPAPLQTSQGRWPVPPHSSQSYGPISPMYFLPVQLHARHEVVLWPWHLGHTVFGICSLPSTLVWMAYGSVAVILQSETYHFHRLDLTRQAGFIVTIYDEDGLRLAATQRCRSQPLSKPLGKRERSWTTGSRDQKDKFRAAPPISWRCNQF